MTRILPNDKLCQSGEVGQLGVGFWWRATWIMLLGNETVVGCSLLVDGYVVLLTTNDQPTTTLSAD